MMVPYGISEPDQLTNLLHTCPICDEPMRREETEKFFGQLQNTSEAGGTLPYAKLMEIRRNTFKHCPCCQQRKPNSEFPVKTSTYCLGHRPMICTSCVLDSIKLASEPDFTSEPNPYETWIRINSSGTVTTGTRMELLDDEHSQDQGTPAHVMQIFGVECPECNQPLTVRDCVSLLRRNMICRAEKAPTWPIGQILASYKSQRLQAPTSQAACDTTETQILTTAKAAIDLRLKEIRHGPPPPPPHESAAESTTIATMGSGSIARASGGSRTGNTTGDWVVPYSLDRLLKQEALTKTKMSLPDEILAMTSDRFTYTGASVVRVAFETLTTGPVLHPLRLCDDHVPKLLTPLMPMAWLVDKALPPMDHGLLPYPASAISDFDAFKNTIIIRKKYGPSDQGKVLGAKKGPYGCRIDILDNKLWGVTGGERNMITTMVPSCPLESMVPSHFAIEIIATEENFTSGDTMDIDCAIPREFLHRGVVLLVRFRKDGPPGSDLKGQYIGNYTTGLSFSQNPLCRTFQSAWLALQPEKDDNTTWILMKSSHHTTNN